MGVGILPISILKMHLLQLIGLPRVTNNRDDKVSLLNKSNSSCIYPINNYWPQTNYSVKKRKALYNIFFCARCYIKLQETNTVKKRESTTSKY